MDFFGKVVDISDPLKLGRVKIEVYGYFDGLDKDVIPWAIPRFARLNQHDLPPLGSTISVEFMHDDIMRPIWYVLTAGKQVNMEDADYLTGAVLLKKDFSEYDSGKKGSIEVRFTETNGFEVEFVYNDARNLLQLRADNSIVLSNDKFKKMIHISDKQISLGTENESAQPAVNGNDNKDALTKLNDTISAMKDEIVNGLTTISSACSASPYTGHLVPGITALKTKVKMIVEQHYKENDSFFPETLSKVVSLDKE